LHVCARAVYSKLWAFCFYANVPACRASEKFCIEEVVSMNKKLYVGNLPYGATEAQVRDLFEQAGEIESVALITDRETGRPKGFGFVEMATVEAAQEAIKRFNGYSFQNRNLTVNEARPREERGGGGFGGGDRGGYGGGGDRGGYGGGGDRGGRERNGFSRGGGDRDRNGGGRSRF
jgi:cold-inducible RNA-binding protein